MDAEISVDRLPLPRPNFIELKDDGFIRNPHWKADEVNPDGIDRLLAMTPTERLQWNEAWKQFIRRCEGQDWTSEMIAAAVWGASRTDESR